MAQKPFPQDNSYAGYALGEKCKLPLTIAFSMSTDYDTVANDELSDHGGNIRVMSRP